MPLEEYQQTLRELLQNRTGSPTVCEWRTQMTAQTYSPRLDIAVGPFSIDDGVQLIQEYDVLYQNNIPFLTQLVRCHLSNLEIINNNKAVDEVEALINHKLDEMRHFNFNSRCFIAIEIENAVSRKHLMGGAINASVLGRVGIAVGYTQEMHNAFLNLYRYFAFLQSVDKPTFRTNNLLVISSEQLIEICVDQ